MKTKYIDNLIKVQYNINRNISNTEANSRMALRKPVGQMRGAEDTDRIIV